MKCRYLPLFRSKIFLRLLSPSLLRFKQNFSDVLDRTKTESISLEAWYHRTWWVIQVWWISIHVQYGVECIFLSAIRLDVVLTEKNWNIVSPIYIVRISAHWVYWCYRHYIIIEKSACQLMYVQSSLCNPGYEQLANKNQSTTHYHPHCSHKSIIPHLSTS